jgi:hypothetical protein
VGLTQQNAQLSRENECQKVELQKTQEELAKHKRITQALQQKVDVYKGTMEDQNTDRLAMIKEKDALLKEYNGLKMFIPEFERMEQA